MIKASTRFLKSFWASLSVPIQLIRANQVVAKQKIDAADFEALTHDDLRKLIDAEQSRAKEIDDKLQKLTAALSVSVAIGGLVGTTMLQSLLVPWAKYLAGGLFLVATIYMLIGVLIGFTGLIPKPRYGLGAKFLRISKGKSAGAKVELIAAGIGFQRDNLIAANQAYAATASIRNGVIAFGAGLLIAMFAWTANQPIKPAITKQIVPAKQAEVAKPSYEPSQLPESKLVSPPKKDPAQKNTSEEKPDTQVPVKNTKATTTPNSP